MLIQDLSHRLNLLEDFKKTSALFGKLSTDALMSSAGELHVSAVLVGALQLECSPIILEAAEEWVSPTLLLLLDQQNRR